MVSIIDKNDAKPFSVDRGRRCQIPTPQPTLTWTPLPHSRLMDAVENQLEKRGYRVHNSTCLLTHGGDRFFGTVSISNRENLGYRRMIGARNSHDKSLAAGLVAGAKVTVCSNGWFFGDEIALSRKHTSRLFEDLDEKIEAGFSRIFQEFLPIYPIAHEFSVVASGLEKVVGDGEQDDGFRPGPSGEPNIRLAGGVGETRI